MSTTVESATAIRPFEVDVSQEVLDDLRQRIAATRWPSKEPVGDRSQGVQLETLKTLAQYYRRRLALAEGETEYDELERRLAECPMIAVPRSRSRATQTVRPTWTRAPMPGNSPANTRTGRSKAASGTTFRRKAPEAFAQAVIDVDAPRDVRPDVEITFLAPGVEAYVFTFG